MARVMAALLATAIVVGASSADAQDRKRHRTGEPSITLFELPNYEGRSMSLYADTPNLADQGFNDRARSARIEGSWRLCEDKNYRSRCEPFANDVRDFAAYDFNNRISSVQQVGGRPGRPGFEGPAYGGPGFERPVAGRDGVEGRGVVFFRRPSLNGVDVAAQGQASADAFCREVGLGGSVYFDERERARTVVDASGRTYANAPALRDVLCRR